MPRHRARGLPLDGPSNTPAMNAAISWFRKRRIPVVRFSPFQLKVGGLSYYPDTGTMNFDGEKRLPERGLAGLEKVLADDKRVCAQVLR